MLIDLFSSNGVILFSLVSPFFAAFVTAYMFFLDYFVATTILAFSVAIISACLVIFYPKSASYIAYTIFIAPLVWCFITYAGIFVGVINNLRKYHIRSSDWIILAVMGISALVMAILLWRFILYIRSREKTYKWAIALVFVLALLFIIILLNAPEYSSRTHPEFTF